MALRRRDLVLKCRQNAQGFPFLKLPTEIRNMIYRLVFPKGSYHCHHMAGDLQMWDPRYTVNEGEVPSSLAILETCRQIYLEAFHIFYRYNLLHFHTTDDMKFCLKSMGHARRQQVRSVSFLWQGHDPKGAFRMLKTCSNLKKIRVCQNMDPDSDYTGFETHIGYLALREVRGLELVETVKLKRIPMTAGSGNHRSIIECVLDPPSVNDGSLAYYMMRPKLAKDEVVDQEIDLFRQPRLRLRATEPEVLLLDQIPWKRRIASGKTAEEREADAQGPYFNDYIHEQYWKT